MKRRPDPAAIRQLHKRTRMVVREHLPHGFLKGIGHRPVRVNPVVVGIVRITRRRLLCPSVLIGCVVEDKIHDQRNPVLPQLIRKHCQVIHRAKIGPDLAVTGHRIATVRVVVRTGEQRHKMQIGNTQFLQIRNIGAHPLQVPCIAVNITKHT